MIWSRRDGIRAYRTRDGSRVRELMHPAVHGNRAQSLAEATVAPGQRTRHHRHLQSEELYHVTAGCGRLFLDDTSLEVVAGDTVCIPPGTAHSILNTGQRPLVILCCCTPPYAHEDTVVLDDD